MQGMAIYLDDKELAIFNRETNENCITGIYQKPNWIINMNVQSSSESKEVRGMYTVTARLITLEDFLSQAQVESEDINNTHRGLELGREKDQEITREKRVIIGEDTEFGTSENNLDRRILDLNQTVSQTDRDKLEKVQEMCVPIENVKRISEGMLWHIRLGHASLEYLKQLQKSEERLEKVKFDRDISECEICILAKMETYHSEIRDPEQPGPCIPYIRTQWDLLNRNRSQVITSLSLCLLTTTRDTPEHIASNTKTKLVNV